MLILIQLCIILHKFLLIKQEFNLEIIFLKELEL
jgi:hypothetical protein